MHGRVSIYKPFAVVKGFRDGFASAWRASHDLSFSTYSTKTGENPTRHAIFNAFRQFQSQNFRHAFVVKRTFGFFQKT
jgi:hypothetical protein